jgi:SAM-dependent methyltransferase
MAPMFSNPLIRSLATSSDEAHLRLSPQDWRTVLEANRAFEEPPERWRGDAQWGRWLLSRAPELRGVEAGRAIELCCGNGFLYFSLRAVLDRTGKRDSNAKDGPGAKDDPGAKLESANDGPLCIDISLGQLRAFRERCGQAGIGPPRIALGDIGKLPVRDGSVRLVYGHSFLHHLPDVGHYLREAARALAPGGLFLATHEPTARAPRWEEFPRNLWKTPVNDSLTDIWLIRPEVITELLRDAGFREVTIRPSGRLAAILVNPWQMGIGKLSLRFPRLASLGYGPAVARARIFADRLERLLPLRSRMEQCPSISICART